MDILNWVYLLKNKLVKTTVQNPEQDLLVLGSKVTYAKRGDKYQSYGMTVQDFAEYVNESVAGNCPIQMNFKPGSIGEKVSFTKVSGSDPEIYKDVIIPGLLEITRGNGGGIYNIAQEIGYDHNVSPLYTSWNTQYIDVADTTWAPLWDVQNRTYTDWRGAVNQPTGGYAPPMYVGTPAVMKYDFDGVVKYWLILFTEWGVGNENQYGFAYDRWEILPEVSFEKPSTGNQNLPFPADIISPGVQITRGNNSGLYNPLFESQAYSNVSPANTKWNSSFTDARTDYSGYTNLNNLESRIYSSFANALDGAIGANIYDTDLIMYDMTTDLYYKIIFKDWAPGCNNAGQDQGEVTGYSVLTPGLGYDNLVDGTYDIYPSGGTGFDLSFNITVLDGDITVNSISNGGYSYTYDDIVTLNSDTATQLLTIQLEVCEQGGFAYTRTVIPQSCGVKFADGTIMNTAVTASAGTTGTAMNYTTGLLSPQVQSDFISLPDTITDAGGTLLNTYKLGGIASFSAPGTSAYSYLIGVISGDSKLALINDASVIGANVNTYDQVSSKFAVNAYVRGQASGNITPLTFATIVLDNTIASPNDYFVSIVATAGVDWEGKAYIDIEFMSDQALSYYN
jgi:hypothetical protein